MLWFGVWAGWGAMLRNILLPEASTWAGPLELRAPGGGSGGGEGEGEGPPDANTLQHLLGKTLPKF